MSFISLQLRRGTAASWSIANPVLAEGELVVETDTGFVKLGDGTTAYNSLTYVAKKTLDALIAAVQADADAAQTDATQALADAAAAQADATQGISDAATAQSTADGKPDLSVSAGQSVSAAAAVAGSTGDASDAGHTHTVSTGTPVAIGASNSAGSGNPLALANHVHALIAGIDSSAASTYSLLASDAQRIKEFTGSCDVTIPANATTSIPVGFRTEVRQGGTGRITFLPASGVTATDLRLRRTRGPGASVVLTKVATDAWTVSQDGLSEGMLGLSAFDNSNYYSTSGTTPIGGTSSTDWHVSLLIAASMTFTGDRYLASAWNSAGTAAGWHAEINSTQLRFTAYVAGGTALNASVNLGVDRWPEVMLYSFVIESGASSARIRVYAGGSHLGNTSPGGAAYLASTSPLYFGVDATGAASGTAEDIFLLGMSGGDYNPTRTQMAAQWREIKRLSRMQPVLATDHWYDATRAFSAPATLPDLTSGTAVDLTMTGTVPMIGEVVR